MQESSLQDSSLLSPSAPPPAMHSRTASSTNFDFVAGTKNKETNISQPTGALAKGSRDSRELPSASLLFQQSQSDKSLNLAHNDISQTQHLAVDPRFYKLPTKRWIDITVFYDIPAIDPVMDALVKHTKSDPAKQQRKVKQMEDYENDPQAFSTLLRTNSWRAAAKLARKRLLACHPGQIDEIMRLWFIRFTSLIRLKLFDVVALELERLGDFESADLRFEKYPDIFPDKNGGMVSLELKLFVAQFPAMKGDIVESINRLYKLMYTIRRSGIANELKDIGVLQVAVVNNLLDLKDWASAIEIMSHIIESNNTNPDILSALGRIYLQIGDILSAKNVFNRVEALVGKIAPALKFWTRPDLVLMNRAYLNMADNDWESATNILTELLTMDPSNAVAVNNLAISQLYMGNVGQAISFLESIAIDMPLTAGVCEPLLFNLATLFDLTDQSSERKKRILLNVVSKNAGDDFAVECLKL